MQKIAINTLLSMQIKLPPKKNSPEIILDNPNKIVVIGANGSGKTRFGSAIEMSYLKNTHRISAQKSLTMPSYVSTTSKEKAEFELWYGGYSTNQNDKNWYEGQGKMNGRWKNNINTSLLNDYEKLMILLHTEEYEESLSFKEINKVNKKAQNPITKLDKIQIIWEKLLPHRKIIKKAGVIDVIPKGSTLSYNASEMSDGERVIFYLIGEAICAKPNSILIIDEPEMHLHKSITNALWDSIEELRTDCTFIYLTHDIDFAVTRCDSVKIWLKSYEDKDIWDYEFIESKEGIPDEIYLEILGSRKPILFIEGEEDESIDIKLYPHIFTDFTIKPLRSCGKVIEATKTFNSFKDFHNISCKGIVDRDRRTSIDMQNLRKFGVYVPDVAEVENILLKECIIKAISIKMEKDPNAVFNQTKQNVIDKFKIELEYQVLLHTKHIIKKHLDALVSKKNKRITEFEKLIKEIPNNIDAKAIYSGIENEFQEYIDNSDYQSILKVYNLKGLLPESKVIQLLGLSNSTEYLNQLINILKKETKDSIDLRKQLREGFEMK